MWNKDDTDLILNLAKDNPTADKFIATLKRLQVDKSLQTFSFIAVGDTLFQASRYELALAVWKDALMDVFLDDSKAMETPVCEKIGDAYLKLGDVKQSIRWYERSLKLAKEIGMSEFNGLLYGNLGIAYIIIGDFKQAIVYQEKALEIARAKGNKQLEANCNSNLGIAYDNLGDFRQAIKFQEKGLSQFITLNDLEGETSSYVNLGIAHYNLSDYGHAMDYYERALSMAVAYGKKELEGSIYTNLGNINRRLGDYKRSVEYHKMALQVAIEIGNRAMESDCYINIGNTLSSGAVKNPTDVRKEALHVAIAFYEKSLSIALSMGCKDMEASCYSSLGVVYLSLGDYKQTIFYEDKALPMAVAIGDKKMQSDCYSNLGDAYYLLNDVKQATICYAKSLNLAKEMENLEGQRKCNFNLGRLLYDSDSMASFGFLKRSIELSELISERIVDEREVTGFNKDEAWGAYQLIVPLCVKLKNNKEAFEYAEGSRSRALLDLLATAKIQPTVKLTAETESLLSQESVLLQELRKMQTRRLRNTQSPKGIGEFDRVISSLNQIYAKLEAIDSEYVFARQAKPLSVDKIKDMLSSQKKDIVLLEYFVTAKATYIFAISTKRESIKVQTSQLTRQRLSIIFENYLAEIVNSQGQDIGNTWLELSDYLISPVSDLLDGHDLIYFVPHDLLHYLPLHALELNGGPIMENHPVAYVPSASLLKFCVNKGTDKMQSCASFGVAFEEEAKDVALLFNAEPNNGPLATIEKVKENTAKDVIHFSCHGAFNVSDALSSGVKLYDGILTAREIFDLHLDTEIVTVSACESGINETSRGDELIGLTRAFLYAGAPSLVVSLWSVDAPSTKELMLDFYKLLKKGTDKAIALQEAQRNARKEHSHPYYWAPFKLIGKS